MFIPSPQVLSQNVEMKSCSQASITQYMKKPLETTPQPLKMEEPTTHESVKDYFEKIKLQDQEHISLRNSKMATFSEVQSSQDAKVGGCEKLKSEFYAKLFENIRFQEARP